MRNVLILLMLAAGSHGLSQGHKIDFKLNGLQDSVVYIGYHLGENQFVHDTLEVIDQQFSLEGEEPIVPGLYFIYTPKAYVEFIVNEQHFQLEATLGKSYEEFQVANSRENELFKTFQVKMVTLQREQLTLQEKLKDATKVDSIEVQAKLVGLAAESKTFRDDLIAQNEGTFLASFLKMMDNVKVPLFADIPDGPDRELARYQYYRAHYFDIIDLEQDGLHRTPLMQRKIMTYLDQVIPQHPDTIALEIDKFISSLRSNPASFRFWVVSLFQKYQETKIMGMDAVVVHLAEQYYLSGEASWMTDEDLEKMRKEVNLLKPNLIGRPAPELVLLDTLLQVSNPLSLEDRFVVLYFYDPDCGHCKKKTPVLRDSYYDLKDLGAEVVAVCTVTDVERWRNYIDENELDWINLADPYVQSDFRSTYNIRSTPQVYVLDENRKIIAKRLDVEQLESFIKDYSALENLRN
ncbi:MAG: redoxin domain-containing protein [Cyclobacteriaceae bacterium]|nr:redoxin domain-containing protein [Cyclobacteriaceae bacterium HetDA_MAG_MS6]